MFIMRSIVLLLLLLSFGLVSICQTAGDTAFSKEYYLQKSKNRKTTGWVLLAGGTTMAVVGGIVFANSDWFSGDDPSTDTGGYLMLGGIVMDLISIPFFISSSHYASKAASISLNNQPILLPQQQGIIAKSQPSITLRIHF
jgi:hypothetical protein